MEKTNTKKHEDGDLNRLFIMTIIMIIMMSILAMGCQENDCIGETYTAFEPVFAAPEDVMSEANFISLPYPIEAPGKIYYKDEHIFITDVDKGIHVIDNTDPHDPQKVGFVDLPGTKDIAAKGDYLYADNYLDLVVLDISDKTDIKEINRVKDVFNTYYWVDEAMGIMIDQEEVEVEYIDCEGNYVDVRNDLWWGWGWAETTEVLFASDASSSGGTGIGGSMARFTISDQYLYTVNDWSMKIFDINTGNAPVEGETVNLGWGIETIFPYEDKLFLGARSGMHIYDNSEPSLPTYVSTYEHINTCDPVVVQDEYAYVTLRSGTECETFTNQLDVLDISDIENPSLVSTFDMDNPHGLGIIGECLFISEGDYGLKLFNAADPMTIGSNLIAHHQDVHAFDVIPMSEYLMMIGDDGLHQYTYDCQDELELISSVTFE